MAAVGDAIRVRLDRPNAAAIPEAHSPALVDGIADLIVFHRRRLLAPVQVTAATGVPPPASNLSTGAGLPPL
jgi:hypothetical protein